MQKLEIGRLGQIDQGPKQDWYVKVDDNSIKNGGSLILLSRSLDPSEDVGLDDWVETEPELQASLKDLDGLSSGSTTSKFPCKE